MRLMLKFWFVVAFFGKVAAVAGPVDKDRCDAMLAKAKVQAHAGFAMVDPHDPRLKVGDKYLDEAHVSLTCRASATRPALDE